VIHDTPLLRRNNDSSWLAHTHTHTNRQVHKHTHTHTKRKYERLLTHTHTQIDRYTNTHTHTQNVNMKTWPPARKYENLASCPDLAVSLRRIPVYHPAACITSPHLRHLFIRQQATSKPAGESLHEREYVRHTHSPLKSSTNAVDK